jgi:hypothetical protein
VGIPHRPVEAESQRTEVVLAACGDENHPQITVTLVAADYLPHDFSVQIGFRRLNHGV